MSELINKLAKDGVQKFSHISRSTLATHERKHPPIDLPTSWKCFTIVSESRGKELKVVLRGHAGKSSKVVSSLHLLFRAGMSGNFFFKSPEDDFPKHAHLRFHFEDSKAAIFFVDPRRFGSWHVTDSWGSQEERGPDLMLELELAKSNITDHLHLRTFDSPICEVLLDQRFFNGVGNYLRAEILHRADLSPFIPARTVLQEALAGSNRLFPECSAVMNESMAILREHGFTDDEDRMKKFWSWLQCYTKLTSAVDGLGRRMWFDARFASGSKKASARAGGQRRGGKTGGPKTGGAKTGASKTKRKQQSGSDSLEAAGAEQLVEPKCELSAGEGDLPAAKAVAVSHSRRSARRSVEAQVGKGVSASSDTAPERDVAVPPSRGKRKHAPAAAGLVEAYQPTKELDSEHSRKRTRSTDRIKATPAVTPPTTSPAAQRGGRKLTRGKGVVQRNRKAKLGQ